jgi:hypothetical protein
MAANPSSNAAQFAVLLTPLSKSDETVHARVEAPFLREARLIQEDTRQGVEMVLSRLPLSEAGQVK